MKTPTRIKNTETNGVSEIRNFSIKANAKAFRTLIDGIYADKILAPVRELMTNAFDSHIAAGSTDVAFKVAMPSRALPEFGVRDYGVGMPHEQVMNSYSTLFESTKDTSNDEVGMLGLGSKSPFAYTDAFTLACFDGQTKRVYSAHLTNDMPQIGLMATVPSTAPRGVEVKFGVSPADTAAFRSAITTCLLGFDMHPEVEGDWDAPIAPIYVGDGYRVFPKDYDTPIVSFRMGCVVYPAPRNVVGYSKFSDIHYADSRFIVDIPIGASDITTDRERLAPADEDVTALAEYLDLAYDDYRETVMAEYEAATTQLEKAEALVKIAADWRRALRLPGPTVSLYDSTKMTEQDALAGNAFVMGAGYYRKDPLGKRLSFDYEVIAAGRMKFLVDDPKAPRRRRRTKDWIMGDKRHRFLVTNDEALKALRTNCGVTDDSIVAFDDIHDPGPPERGTYAGKARTPLGEQRARIAAGEPWAIRMRGHLYTLPYSMGGVHNPESMVADVPAARAALGWDDATTFEEGVVFLTEKEHEKIDPPEEQHVARMLHDVWEVYADDIWAIKTSNQVRRYLIDNDTFGRWEADRIMEAEGFPTRYNDELQTVLFATNANERDFGPSPTRDEVLLIVEGLKARYPALLAMTRTQTLDYINNQKEA